MNHSLPDMGLLAAPGCCGPAGRPAVELGSMFCPPLAVNALVALLGWLMPDVEPTVRLAPNN